jgi:hypothetical protein
MATQYPDSQDTRNSVKVSRKTENMALNWSSVKPEHVRRACESILASSGRRRFRPKGLVVQYEGQQLPAKQVLGTAFRIANGLESESRLHFSSGQSTIDRLRALGFVAGRALPSEPGVK